MTAYAPITANNSSIGNFPCEGAKTIKIDIDFVASAENIIDLSTIQAMGGFSAVQTIFIDNRLNDEPVFFECNVAYQTFACPPGGYMYMPVLQPTPPVFKITSAGQFVIPIHFINFFLPPLVWSPDAPPGGGGGGGASVLASVTNRSGASPVAIPANAARKWLIISNPIANAASTFINFAGGGNIELTLGGIYESGPAVPGTIVNITNAGGSIIAYEGA